MLVILAESKMLSNFSVKVRQTEDDDGECEGSDGQGCCEGVDG